MEGLNYFTEEHCNNDGLFSLIMVLKALKQPPSMNNVGPIYVEGQLIDMNLQR